MAFFNLTELGAHDPVKFCIDNKEDRLNSSINGEHAHADADGKTTRNSATPASVTNNSQAQGSYVKYTSMLKKHQRSPKGNEKYKAKHCSG